MTREQIEEQLKMLQKEKLNFIENNVNIWGGEENVILFIVDILYNCAPDVPIEDSIESIRHLFEAGYCYYFAKMLEDAFPGGTICVCYPFGHIVYVYNEVAYDICGVTDAEFEMLMPVELLGSYIDDFRHVPGVLPKVPGVSISTLSERCKREQKDVFALCKYPKCAEVVEKCKAVVSANPPAKFVPDKIQFNNEIHYLTKESRCGNISWQQREQFLTEYCIRSDLSWKLIQRLHKEAHNTESVYQSDIIEKSESF